MPEETIMANGQPIPNPIDTTAAHPTGQVGFFDLATCDADALYDGVAADSDATDSDAAKSDPSGDDVRDERPARERLAELMARLGSQRDTAVAVLRLCAAPQTVDALKPEVARLQRQNFSVLDAPILCNLLERAGGLAKVTPTGEPYPADAGEPQLVEEDGASYYEVRPAPPVCWATTSEGRDLAAEQNPAQALKHLLESEEEYRAVYVDILARCATEGGMAMKALDSEFKDHPQLQEPRRYASYFIDRLEAAGGVAWTGSWETTDTGRALLDEAL